MSRFLRFLSAFLILTTTLGGIQSKAPSLHEVLSLPAAEASVSTETCFGTDCSTMHHFEGAAFSQTFTDSSVNNVTWTADGNCNLDTAQKKFGNTSPYHDGTGDGMHAADGTIWTFTGNFTIDFWVRFENIASARTLFSQATDTSNYHELVLTGGNITYTVQSGGAAVVSYSQAWTPTLGVWYHVALVHDGTDYDVYIDGTTLGTLTDASNPADYTGNFYIGISNATGSLAASHRGWIDEWRATKDLAIYTANFTPQSAAYEACASDRRKVAVII